MVCFSVLKKQRYFYSLHFLRYFYLWKNNKDIKESCFKFITLEQPSIIEPCFKEIQKLCISVKPGNRKVHQCLYDNKLDLTLRCSNSLATEKVIYDSQYLEIINLNNIQTKK